MQKGSAGFLVVIATLLILIIGGVYLYKTTPNTTLQSSKSASLKTQDYSNQNLGFTFKYPAGLSVNEDSEEQFDKRGNGNFRKNFTGYVGYEPGKFLGAVVVLDKTNGYDTNPFTIWVFNNDNYLTIEQWYQQYWYYPFIWGDFTYTGKTTLAPKDEATVSGQMAKSGVIDYQPGKPKFIYISKDKKMYLFRIIGEIGDKILSSFKLLKAETKNAGGCQVGGCSGQLCIEKSDRGISTCEWKEEYACYKGARCERQADGKCGWTKTEELTQCLKEKSTPVYNK